MLVSNERFALVTGGAKRLGRAMVLGLARAGWNVLVHHHTSHDEAAQTVQDAKALGVQAHAIQADLACPQQVLALFKTAIGFGPLRCVVNNAALFQLDTPQQFDVGLFDAHMACNARAPMQLTSLLHAHVPNGETAVVVNVLDQKLFNQNPDFLSYTLSKASLHTATMLSAMALAPKLRVLGIAPGLTLISHMQTPEQFESTHKMAPLQRSSQPEDIVKALLFLLDSHAMTGTVLLVDGGQHLMPMPHDFSVMHHELLVFRTQADGLSQGIHSRF